MSAYPLECPADLGAHDKPCAAGMDGLQPPVEPTREGAGMGGDHGWMHPRGGAKSELYKRPRGGSSSLRRATSVIFGGPTINSTWSGERLSPGDSYDCPKVDVGGGQFQEPRVGVPRSHRNNHNGGHSAEAEGPWPKGIGAASLPADAEEAEVGVSIWIAGPSVSGKRHAAGAGLSGGGRGQKRPRVAGTGKGAGGARGGGRVAGP